MLFNQPYQLRNYNYSEFPNPKKEKAGYCRMFKKDDILFLTIRSNRKVWLADQEGVCNTSIQVLIPNQELIYPQFLINLLVSKKITDWIQNCSQGSTFPTIIWKSFIQKKVIIPSLEKQGKILICLKIRQRLIRFLQLTQKLENLLHSTNYY